MTNGKNMAFDASSARPCVSWLLKGLWRSRRRQQQPSQLHLRRSLCKTASGSVFASSVACACTLHRNMRARWREEMGEDASGWAGTAPVCGSGAGGRTREQRGPFFVINGQDILWPLSPISSSEEHGDISKRGV